MTAAALLLVPHYLLPAEDAVILFQYSRNLAHHAAITFIPNGPRAEGATDFGWMVLLAGGIRCGLNPFWVVAVVNVVSLVLMAMLLVRLAGKPVRPLPVLFLMGAFAFMPQILAAAAGFSTLPFALLLTLLAFCYLRGQEMALPFVGLLLCLFRPDGVVFTIPILVAGLVPAASRIRRLRFDLLLFVLPGVAYFLWRWHYFGELLPLPFLVKSDTVRILHYLHLATLQQAKMFCIFAAVLLTPLLSRCLRRKGNLAILLCLVVLPNVFYFAMRLDQNIGHRFFIYFPVGISVLLAWNWPAVERRKGFYLALGTVSALLTLGWIWHQEAEDYLYSQHDARQLIALELNGMPHGSMIVTEAGILPYTSQWTAYDAWGLNTAVFAHRLLQPSDVRAIHPDIVMLHTELAGDAPPAAPAGPPGQKRTWSNMIGNLIAGIDPKQYALWVVPYGSTAYRVQNHLQPWQEAQEFWYIRRDSPLAPAIEQDLQDHQGETYAQFHAHRSAEVSTAPQQPPSRFRRLIHKATHGINRILSE